MNQINVPDVFFPPAATQIFVDPDGEVKFEMSEMEQDIVEEVATTGGLEIAEDVGSSSSAGTSPQNKFHPVKKRNSTVVSKCNRCNGTGMIYIEASGATASCGSHGNSSAGGSGGGGNHSSSGLAGIVPKREKGGGGGGGSHNTITVELDAMQAPAEPGAK